jgi:aspartyl-tRNA(Asn)/glutamyl-tRNA(Gln) amidotransferase subunit A
VNPAGWTAAAAIERLRAGELSAAELFEASRERVERLDPELGSYLWVTPGAGAEPVRGEAPLAGLPVAVKDIFCTEDVPTTAGSRILEGYRPPYTATAVRRLREAGAPMLGKTNMDEFAMGSSSENSGFGPVRNPWDRDRVPGGSSGGSAAAVAAGLAPWAIGTDTGGSIRQPASLCGIVGMKPTYGAVSRYGMVAFASSLDQCGPLTRDVTDAALLLRHLVGRDPCDSTSLDSPSAIELPSREDLGGLRFGVPAELSSEAEGVEPGVAEAFERTLGPVSYTI